MSKKRRSRAVTAKPGQGFTSVPVKGKSLVMTENGYEPVDKAPRGSQGAVHAPQLMKLSTQYTSPRRGTRELLKLYGESPWLRAIVGKIGRAVAETDWLLYAKKDLEKGRYVDPGNLIRTDGTLREHFLSKEIDKGTVDQINSHPLLDLLANGTGNPRLNGFASLQVTQMHLDLAGEGFWLLEPDELGVPIAFWPLPPSWVNKFPSETMPFYEISVPGGASVRVPTTMIVPFIEPDPENPYGRGTGIAKSLDDEIQIDEYAAKHAKSFFLNRARPDIIVSGQFISPKDAERLEKQWLADHQGFWKSFKPLFFSQKVDIKELSQSFESLQMVQMRKHERDTFVSVFGAPPEKFGIIGESKRSTINAADYFWNKDLIKPRVEMIRRILQQVLTPRFDERLILHYDTPVLQDEEMKLQAMRQAPWASSINEWRKMQGQESLGEAGEVLVVPLNSVLVPIKKGGLIMPAEDVVEEAARLAAKRGPHTPAIEFDTSSVAADIAKELVDVIEGQFKKLEHRNSE